jgi:hypothetical protein
MDAEYRWQGVAEVNRPLVDWQQCALNIRRHVSLEKAAIELGRNRRWLYCISDGKTLDPAFSDAVRLLDLHLDLCGPEETEKLWTR